MCLIERINIRKKHLGITSDELAARSGIPLGTINKVMNGQTADPRLSTIRRIARTLHCSIDYLVGFSDSPFMVDMRYDKLPDSSRTWLLARFQDANDKDADYYKKVIETVDNR